MDTLSLHTQPRHDQARAACLLLEAAVALLQSPQP